MLLAPARKRNVQCDARRRHRRCRYENRTSARPVGSSRIRLHGVAGARKRGAMSLPGNHVGSRQWDINTPPRKLPRAKVNEVLRKYFSSDPSRSSAWFRTVESLFDRYIVPRYGNCRLSEIHAERWSQFVEFATLDQPSRGINLHKGLRSFLNWAVKHGLLHANPLARTKVELPILPGPTQQERLSIKDLVVIYQAAQRLGEPWSTMIGLMILTGEAMEDVRRIESSRVDWDKYVWVPKRQNTFKYEVPLSPEAVTLLLPYRNTRGYYFRSPRLPKSRRSEDLELGFPINFYTEIIDRLRYLAHKSWTWGLRDIRHAVRWEIGKGADAVLAWSKRFADMVTEEEVSL